MSNQDHKQKPYLIPKNVRTIYQIFPGMGWREVRIVGATAFSTLAIAFFFVLFFKLYPVLILPFFASAIVWYGYQPQADGSNTFELMIEYRKWKRTRRALY